MTQIISNITDNIIFRDYLDASFWTASGRSEFSSVLWFLILSVTMIGLGLIIIFLVTLFVKDYPPKRKLLIPFSWILIGLGVSGVVFGLLRIEGVTFFSGYGFWALIILGFIATVSYFGFRYIFYLPKEQVSYETLKIKKKYLPKRKK